MVEPKIIPRSEHRISRKQISPNALRALYRLHNHGFAAFLVGGCVRDLLLEKVPKDFDVVSDATPGQIRKLFRNCRLIGRRFRLAHLHYQNEIIEVATFRRSTRDMTEKIEPSQTEQKSFPKHHHVKDAEGMVLRDNVFGTPEEDALSRDFTVNALFYNIADFSIIDYSTGISDLNKRIIRPIGEPFTRFTEDPVRMLRAVRLAASHGFTIEPSAWEAIRDLSSLILRADNSRLYEELLKTFLYGFASSVLPLLNRSGLLASLFPDFQHWLHSRHDSITVVRNNLEYLDQVYAVEGRPSTALLLAALFGPLTEETAVLSKHEGIPYQPAIEAACKVLTEHLRTCINVPKLTANQFRSLLTLQSAFDRIPPKRPSALLQRSEFSDALVYFRMMSSVRKENHDAVKWWEKYISSTRLLMSRDDTFLDTEKKKKRKRRRRRSVSRVEKNP